MEGKGKGKVTGPCLCDYVDQSSDESHRYYLARKNVLEMLRDRGYLVSEEDMKLSLEEFRTVYGEHPDVDRLRLSAHHRSDFTKKVYRECFVFPVIFRFLAIFFLCMLRDYCLDAKICSLVIFELKFELLLLWIRRVSLDLFWFPAWFLITYIYIYI